MGFCSSMLAPEILIFQVSFIRTYKYTKFYGVSRNSYLISLNEGNLGHLSILSK